MTGGLETDTNNMCVSLRILPHIVAINNPIQDLIVSSLAGTVKPSVIDPWMTC